MKFLKVYSHPRSGTHFLMNFLSSNLYKDKDLASKFPIYYGHWSNKIFLEGGEPHFELFGGHLFPSSYSNFDKGIYIYRDGREVIASLWNGDIYNIKWRGITFSEFLRKEIDWYGGPGQQRNATKLNIVQHWYQHVDEWVNLNNKNIISISYQDLKNDPGKNI
jgi:bile-salt sulfotransferase